MLGIKPSIVPHFRFKILLAPDSFKGSLSALDACEAMERGVLRAIPDAQIISVPLADGGEGVLDAMLQSASGRESATQVLDPLGKEISASWGILESGEAVIEMARASGLTLVEEKERDARRASSFGTGQLIKCALDFGCSQLFIGIGGSATTDGGAGALSALGARFLDARGGVLPPGGAALCDLDSIDLSHLDARLKNTRITVLCDVTNTLFGKNGAAFVYAPQKGASQNDVEILDDGLKNLAEVSARALGRDRSTQAGAGAAGGMGFGLVAFCNAELKSGIEVVLEAARFNEKIADADLILTGEGALDAQTLSGKAIAGVCASAKKYDVPVIALGGKVSLSGDEMNALGLLSAFSICDVPLSFDECIARASELLENTTERVLRVWLAANTSVSL